MVHSLISVYLLPCYICSFWMKLKSVKMTRWCNGSDEWMWHWSTSSTCKWENQAPFHLIRHCTCQAGIQVVINFASTSFVKTGLQGIFKCFCYPKTMLHKRNYLEGSSNKLYINVSIVSRQDNPFPRRQIKITQGKILIKKETLWLYGR